MKKQTLSNFLALLLLLCVTIAIFTACGGSTEQENGASNGESSDSISKEENNDSNTDGGSDIEDDSNTCKHEVVIDAAVEATCTTEGKTEGSHCSKCGEVLKAQEVVPAKGHTWEDRICLICNALQTSEGLEFELDTNSDTYYVTGLGTCEDDVVVIPDTYNNQSVTGIRRRAFKNCSSINTVIIPDSVTNIGVEAFYNCNKLASFVIGNNITSIGLDAFIGTAYYANNSNWTNGVLYLDKYLIASNNNNIEGVCIINNGTLCIADSVFSECKNLTSVVIPDSVISIPEKAFYRCTNLNTITVADSVTSVGDEAFDGTAYYINKANWINGVLYIGKCLIEVDDNIKGNFTINEDTRCIAASAFSYCRNITSIVIPNSVISIGLNAFSNCSSLTSIVIPNNVTSIESGAFQGCTKLTSITIPNSVTSIGYGAFQNCTGLTSVAISESITSIPSNAFYQCTNLTAIVIPNGVTRIGKWAFSGCTNLTSAIIPDSVTSIANGVFQDCTSLTSISIGNGLTSIGGSSTFEDTPYYKNNENWKNGVLYINKYLIGIDTDIVEGNFIIKNDTQCIADSAFSYCHNITSVVIPSSITNMNSEMFFDCSSMTDIWCESKAQPPQWNENWNDECPAKVHWGDSWEYINGVPTLK